MGSVENGVTRYGEMYGVIILPPLCVPLVGEYMPSPFVSFGSYPASSWMGDCKCWILVTVPIQDDLGTSHSTQIDSGPRLVPSDRPLKVETFFF